MLRECLVFSSMRLGVPFIAPRQLGAVESNPGRQFLPSVAWRTGQSGAPPDTVRCRSLSLSQTGGYLNVAWFTLSCYTTLCSRKRCTHGNIRSRDSWPKRFLLCMIYAHFYIYLCMRILSFICMADACWRTVGRPRPGWRPGWGFPH